MTVHGKSTKVFWNSLDLSPYLDSIEYALETDTADATTFGDGFKEYAVGQYTATVSCTGKYDATSDEAIEGQMRVDSGVLTYSPGAGATRGDVARLVSVTGTLLSTSSPVGDIVAFAWDATSQGAASLGWLQNPLEEDTDTTVNGAHDTGVTSSTGWTAHLHVTLVDGGSWVIKFSDSADNSAWADVTGASFTALSAPGSQRLQSSTSTATLRQYVRCVATRTGGSSGDGITYALAIARTV